MFSVNSTVSSPFSLVFHDASRLCRASIIRYSVGSKRKWIVGLIADLSYCRIKSVTKSVVHTVERRAFRNVSYRCATIRLNNRHFLSFSPLSSFFFVSLSLFFSMTIRVFRRIHRNVHLSLSPIVFALFAGVHDITGGHAPVNRINARNLYP